MWCGGNSYYFRETKENVTEEVLSKELKAEDWARYTEGRLRQMNDKQKGPELEAWLAGSREKQGGQLAGAKKINKWDQT